MLKVIHSGTLGTGAVVMTQEGSVLNALSLGYSLIVRRFYFSLKYHYLDGKKKVSIVGIG